MKKQCGAVNPEGWHCTCPIIHDGVHTATYGRDIFGNNQAVLIEAKKPKVWAQTSYERFQRLCKLTRGEL